MRAALLIAAFFGWGVVGGFLGYSLPGAAFLVGLGVGAGAMLFNNREK